MTFQGSAYSVTNLGNTRIRMFTRYSALKMKDVFLFENMNLKKQLP